MERNSPASVMWKNSVYRPDELGLEWNGGAGRDGSRMLFDPVSQASHRDMLEDSTWGSSGSVQQGP
jgi:hypothetical protein